VIWYADASFLVSAFGEDANTAEAKSWLRKGADFPLLITRLTVLEAETALRAAVAGQRLTADKMTLAMAGMHRATLEGYLHRKDAPQHQWFPQAHRISAHAGTASVGRALDILHISAAVIFKADGLLTFDKDQRALAESQGLKVQP
jgi:predicted nucleic acid-binding protein